MPFISESSADIVHVSGDSNGMADALSRIISLTIPSDIDIQEFIEEERNDSELRKFLQDSTSSLQLTLTEIENKGELF